MMEKNYLIQLTQGIYRMTLLFPKKEPLRYKMRELADDILAENGSPETLDKLAVLDSFFEVVKVQNWVAVQDVLNLQAEYSKLDGEIKPQSSLSLFKEEEKLPDRQGKIMAFLRENGRAQVWQVKQILPEVTKRTLRRDFDQLLNQGVIERMGERNETFYQLKIRES
ncbi:MAG: DeoR family transcriptional regulator [Patescibacteria group bacterium]|mgnify:CR=1 FL=1